MNIKNTFLESLTSTSSPFGIKNPEIFLGKVFDQPGLNGSFFHVLAGGSIKAVFPYSFDIYALPCYMILYTQNGCGKLLIDNQVYTLGKSTFLFLDCNRRFRMDIAISPWNYQVLFVTGDILSDYRSLLSGTGIDMTQLPRYAAPILEFEKLLLQAASPSVSSQLACSAHLHSLLSSFIIAKIRESEKPAIDPYLSQIKELFDLHFDAHYSLDELADTFHVSKYRLCREFGNAFEASPIQYLNQKRIEAAKHLLFTTSLKVHEIGSQVGIDNTNHFISLFKKYTGQTPLEYKQSVML